MTNYWAQKIGDEFLQELNRKVSEYDDYLMHSGILSELRDSFRTFYSDTKINDFGRQGEHKLLCINQYASLCRSLISLVTTNRPSFQPISANTDSSSNAATVLALGLLDYYMSSKRLDRMFRNAALQCCFLREAWISCVWNPTEGEPIAVTETGTLNEGDLEFNLFGVTDVIRDVTKKNHEHKWLITRQWKNKYDLVAQYPDLEDKILASYPKELDLNMYRIDVFSEKLDHDDIPFYTMYFEKCPSLPQGRLCMFVNGAIIFDGPLPYDKKPLIRLCAEEKIQTGFGHSPMMDLLPLQKARDMLSSAILTNQSAFAVQNILVPKGSGVSVRQLADGMNFIEYDSKTAPPSALQLTATSGEVFKFFDMLSQEGQLISGVNSAVRGQASPGQSGAALALLADSALKFASSLEQSYTSLIEDIGTLMINILQRYASTKRVAIISGKHNKPLLKEWSSQDLEGVSRVTVESGNALSKTASGRLTIADSLLQSGMIQDPAQYITVLTTGRLEPLYEAQESQLRLIRDENETLAEGGAVIALITDDHKKHILDHASVLANPMVRQSNSIVVKNTLDHIQQHLDLAQSMPPALAMLLKQDPLPSDSKASAPGKPVPEVMDGSNSVMTAAGQVQGPNFPTNPATGEQYGG